MAVDEAARHQLYNDLVKAVGPESTGTIMELLQPVGGADVATKQDLDELGHRVDAQVSQVRTEMAELRTEVRTEIGGVRTEMAELRGDLRTELADGLGGLQAQMVTGQRQLFFGVLTAMFTFAGLVWAALTFLG